MTRPDATGRPSRRLAFGAVAVVTALAYTATLLLVSSPYDLLWGVVGKAVFVLPGLLLLRAIVVPGTGWLPVVAFGPLIGFGLSSLALLGLWVAGGRGEWTLFASPVLVCAALLPFAKRLQGRWLLPATLPGDRTMLLAAMLIVPLVVAAPFANVGKDISAGRAYRAYFTADYVWRRAVVSELAKGSMLPANPFYGGDALHYYWFPHLSTAVTYRDAGPSEHLDELLLQHSIVIDGFFVAFLYGLARWFVRRPGAAALGVAATVLCSSFEGSYSLWEHWRLGAPLDLVRYMNIDAISRWLLGGMPIDGLQRVLFYQPHHAIGYGLGFLGVFAVAFRTRKDDAPAMAVAGTLLALGTLTSSFAGLMLTCVAALCEAVAVARDRAWWRALSHASASALPLAIGAALVTALQYVDNSGTSSVIRFGLNPVAAHRAIASTFLSAGPMLIVGALAALVAWRGRLQRGGVFVALAAVCVGFYFYVDIRDHQDVYVGWRVGHLWFIASCALCAVAFEWVATRRPLAKAAAAMVLAAVLAVALPTTVIDIYNTQDIFNWAAGPGFTWTLILGPEELEAFAWIKAHTPLTATVQVDAVARDVQGWAYVPAFAERRMAIGLPISMVPLRKYEQGSRRAATIFEASASMAHALAQRANVDYLLIGSPERRAHPGILDRMDAAADLFERVFQNREITIYRVSRGR